MTPNERSLIEDLFNRLRGATSGPRDAEAEAAIASEMARSPGAAYAMVQTVLVQDQALREAHDKIQAAEAAAQQAAQQPPPSFLERAGSALQGFGGQRSQPQQAWSQQAQPQQSPWPSQQQPEQPPAQGGGFMRGALQTAAGVAGGALLFEGVRSMFGGGGGLLGGGSGGPWGQQPTEVVNETIINEAPGNARDDNLRDASYDSSDDNGNDNNDDGSFDSSDDDSYI